jgi:CheY-like chemotaxis protein
VSSGGEQRPKILIIADEQGAQRFLSTYLSSMACSCTVATTDAAVAATVARETFDAAILDLRYSVSPAQRLSSVIEEIPPSLVSRTMVISKDRPDEAVIHRLQRLGIPRIPQNRLLAGLWETIQNLLVAPRIGQPARKGQRVARMMFDSSQQSRPRGLRAAAGFGRHLAYQFDSVTVDISIEPSEKPDRLWLVGQVVDSQSGRGLGKSLPVILNGHVGPLARTFTEPSGEFTFEVEFTSELELELRTDKGVWVMIPLPRVTWREKPFPWRAAG